MALLFRPEALQAQRVDWLGSVRLVQPIGLAWLTLWVLAVLVAAGTFLYNAQYTRKATVAGVLVPDRGLIRLLAPQAGVVVQRLVHEGQTVSAGDALFVLEIERPTLAASGQAQVERSLDDRRRALNDATRLQQALAESRIGAVERRLQSLATEQAQLEQETRLQQQRLALARESHARLEALQRDNFISPAQVQAKSEELLALQVQLQGLARQGATLSRERAELEGERRVLPLQARGVEGDLKRDLATLSRETAEQQSLRQFSVRAPQAGTVSAVVADVGQSILPTAALASLVPAGAALQAQLYAPSGAVGFVQPGQAVRLRYEAFPYQKFGQAQGRVIQVSRVPLAAGELAALAVPAAERPGEPMFRITVVLDAAGPVMPQPLMAGMRMQADVLLERRRLIEWLFEPLLGLAERV